MYTIKKLIENSETKIIVFIIMVFLSVIYIITDLKSSTIICKTEGSFW